MTVPARKDRITGLERAGFAAHRLVEALAAVEPFPMPPDLAQRLRDLAAAARDVVSMAEREVLALEAARDWQAEDPT